MKTEAQQGQRLFIVLFAVLIIAVLIVSSLLTFMLDLSGVLLLQYSDGTVMLGEKGKADNVRPPSILPATTITVYDAPRPSVPVETAESQQKELTFNEIYKKVVHSVAVINSESSYGSGTGTGIILSEDGYIATNYHVVEGAEILTVTLYDGAEHEALLVGSDRISDLAVLKIYAGGLTPAQLGNSDLMEHGDPVAAIGNPLGIELRNTITSGIISGVNRDITIEDASGDIAMTVLQTNCAVNPGNSGGPLLNQYGQVVGIISSKIMGSASQSVEGLGFAIPSNTAAPLIAQLIEFGYIKGRPAFGIIVDTSYTEAVAQYYGLPPGIRVTSVNESSDAYTKGLQPNDIITHIDGVAIVSLGEVNDIKNKHVAGDTLRLTVYRLGETLTIDILLMEEGSMR